MSHASPSPEQQALYQYIMRNAPISREATLTPYEFSGAASDRYWVATTRLYGSSSKAFLTLSLPELSNKVFLGISDDYPQTFAELVGSFNAESECNDALRVGYAELIDSPVLNQYGWDGVLMSEPKQLIENFPNSTVINDEEREFILITLITRAEYTVWRTQGYDALLARFERQRRDVFHFHQKTIGDTRVVQHPTQKQSIQEQPSATVNTAVASQGATARRADTLPTVRVPAAQVKHIAPAKQMPHPSVTHQPSATHQIVEHRQTATVQHAAPDWCTNPFNDTRAVENIPKDPMRINLGVEPSSEFITPPPYAQASAPDGRPQHPSAQHQTTTQRPATKPPHTITHNITSHSNTPNQLNHSPTHLNAAPKPVTPKNAAPKNVMPTQERPIAQKPLAPPTHSTQQLSQPLTQAAVKQPVQGSTQPKHATPKQSIQPKRPTQTKKQSVQPASTVQLESNRNSVTPKRKPQHQQTHQNAKPFSSLDKISKVDEWADTFSALDDTDSLSAYEQSLLELTYDASPRQHGHQRWQVVGETALGTVLLTGGLFATLFFIDSQTPVASVLPGVFAVSGLVTLASAFKDAIGLEKKAPSLAQQQHAHEYKTATTLPTGR
ncbi:MAG: hypothetical protein P8144_13735 [Gammaproteobacteria bacterium]